MSGRRTTGDDERLRTDGGRDPEALTDLDGIGPARADKLRDAGFETVADLRAANRDDLVDVLGADLADQVIGQVGAEAADDEPATEDTEPEEDGPSVPAGGDSDSMDASGPSVPSGGTGETGDASGPSVPGGAESTTTVDRDEPSEQAGRDTGGTGGQTGGTDTTTTATTGSGATGAGTATGTQGGTQTTGSDEDALLAGLVSFFIPGVGNMITGDTDRGVIILVLWIVWLVIGWGVIFLGLSFLLTAITLGLGIILVPLIGIVVGLVEFVIHVVAAIDAYRGSKVVDNVTGKVNQVRGN